MKFVIVNTSNKDIGVYPASVKSSRIRPGHFTEIEAHPGDWAHYTIVPATGNETEFDLDIKGLAEFLNLHREPV